MERINAEEIAGLLALLEDAVSIVEAHGDPDDRAWLAQAEMALHSPLYRQLTRFLTGHVRRTH